MKRFTFLFAGAAMVAALASCNKENTVKTDVVEMNPGNGCELAVMSGVETKGYVDGTTFYEKATADLHKVGVDTVARTMKLSAYLTPQSGTAGNYFVGETFANDGTGIWRHTPAYYWPMSSKLDFLAYSSTNDFAAKDAKWDASNASQKVVLTFDRARCQDDVLYAAQSMTSDKATDITGGSGAYKTAQPVNMEFKHSQAWIEFQLSVADSTMRDKIAIKEIVLKDAYDSGELTVIRDVDGGQTVANASWVTGISKDIVFDDTYLVYGHSKTVDEYTVENALIKTREKELEEARLSGNADAIAAAEIALQAAVDARNLAVAQYPVVNALNAVGAKNERTEASAEAENAASCAYLDMLLPQQPKANIIIRYVLAGKPDVLEYKYTLKKDGANWVSGHKYIYDLDFVISEIVVKPTVKAWEATFDGTDLKPVELL